MALLKIDRQLDREIEKEKDKKDKQIDRYQRRRENIFAYNFLPNVRNQFIEQQFC